MKLGGCMLIVSYDFSNNKVRAKFAKFLESYGVRLQYSVFELKYSKRMLDLILAEIENHYVPLFTNADSVLIFNAPDKDVIKYGYAIHREQEVVFID